MQIELAVVAIIVFYILSKSGRISISKLIADNEMYFRRLKESDYEFYVKAKYGDSVNADILFNKRLQNSLIVMLVVFCLLLKNMSYLYFIVVLIVGFAFFKLDYMNLKGYYKKHLHEIDTMLPYYLKGLEILIQHYTVPVAIGKSLDDAPDIFKDGLKELINKINAGDDTIEPYMDFARQYPVRDSMRMMRLLYRLSLGRQERKQEQLIAFSKTISNLQQKARETKYKNRLDKMESKTMSMLIATGVGVMVLLIISVLILMNASG
ncbi:MAG: hypothetical protein HFI49_04595 [Bacilli bacterium]|jgi:hypothetical protein|nr:hypothetical protein [Bacilli bacterium]